MASWSGMRRPQIEVSPLTANIINVLKAGIADEIGLRNPATAFPRNCCADWGKGICKVEAEMTNRRMTHPIIWAGAEERKGMDAGGNR